MLLPLVFALLHSAAFGCMKVQPGNGGIPAGCPVFDAWSNEACAALLGGQCVAATLTSTSVTCPTTGPYRKIYMKGVQLWIFRQNSLKNLNNTAHSFQSRDAKAYQSVECDQRTKRWNFVDLAYHSMTQAEVEAVYGAPLMFACVGR
ncbi:hypothetical protein PRIPAC_79301 [Pristionchus pacificus]|uniref:Uncharacterized protein n=1 Tax=Pristionchus pacificus TaxID=54126 RepID=A0A2A6CJC6_PRIPA|nr:hypothetical protein PRIPAC_79301 [Pristionchus pacificus]|eukprot:PDM78324.1 hypothetical protein PRIPAC_30903 [Pristionchus pacificus]